MASVDAGMPGSEISTMSGTWSTASSRPGPRTGAPILDGAIAAMECRTHAIHDGGDHSIVVGEVLGVSRPYPDGSPLLYYDGDYRRVHPR